MATQDYPAQIVTVFIAVDDATVENGCLEVAPLVTLQPHALGPVDGSSAEDWQNTEQRDLSGVRVPLSAGDALVFSALAPHRSARNSSDADRRGILLSFSPAGLGGSFYGLKTLDDGGGGAAARAAVAYRERGETSAAPAHARSAAAAGK